ncbi:MAG: hypothetical protein FK730_04720 [Asgard group archaeon]|nr:hypothetical protein [Asgard group archaeon]
MLKKKITLILIIALFCSQNFLLITNAQNKKKITYNHPYKEDLGINNFSTPNYVYTHYYLDNNIIYLFDPWNCKIGIYNLENITNPKEISEGIYYGVISESPNSDFHEIYKIENFEMHIVNFNESCLFLKSFDIGNCSNIQQISSIALEHNLTINQYNYYYHPFSEDNQLFVFFANHNYNEAEKIMSHWLYYIEVNTTNPTLPKIENNYLIFNETRYYSTEAYTNYHLHFENNYLFYYRNIRNYTQYYSNGHFTHIRDNSYEMIVFDLIDISTPIICSQKNFTNEYQPQFQIENQIVYFKPYNNDLEIYNYTNPYQPTKIGSYYFMYNPLRCILIDQILYLVRYDQVDVLEVQNNELNRINRFNPHHIYFNTGFYRENKLVLICPANYIDKIFVILNCTNPEKLTLIYPNSLKMEFWYKFSLLFPIFTSVTILLAIMFSIFIKRRKKQSYLQNSI